MKRQTTKRQTPAAAKRKAARLAAKQAATIKAIMEDSRIDSETSYLTDDTNAKRRQYIRQLNASQTPENSAYETQQRRLMNAWKLGETPNLELVVYDVSVNYMPTGKVSHSYANAVEAYRRCYELNPFMLTDIEFYSWIETGGKASRNNPLAAILTSDELAELSGKAAISIALDETAVNGYTKRKLQHQRNKAALDAIVGFTPVSDEIAALNEAGYSMLDM